MQFENTYQLLWLLLLLPAAVLVYFTIRWKKNLREKLGDSRLIANLFTRHSPKKFLLKSGFLLATIALLVVALTNLRQPDSSEKVKLSGTDLMIALDVSNSMLAEDIQPSRLEKAKLLIGKLIDQLQGNRIGMVVFAGNAYLQMPLTTDASAARLFLGNISPNLVPYQGTNISEALQVCNRSFTTAEKKYKSILLISDGEDHDNTTLETAEKLKQDGVVINTVGIGSPQGATLLDPATNSPRKDDEGNVVISKLNQVDLQKIAASTNGNYILLDNTDAAANTIASDLGKMDQKPITDTTLTNFSSYYYWFVVAAVLLLLADLLLGETKRKKDLMKPTALLILLFFSGSAFSQKENQQLRSGNEAYRKQQYDSAAKDYEAALKTNATNSTATFNLGNTRFRNGKYEDAIKQYDNLGNTTIDKKLQAKAFYNKGLSQIKQQKLAEGIESFKQSLKMNPQDEETRQNLQKALNEKKKQDQQQQDKKQDKKKDDKKKDDKKDKNDKDDQQQDKNKDQKQQQDQNQQQQPPPKIKKEDAEQKLQALRQEEKKLQQKLNERQQATTRQPSKNW